MDVLYQSVIFRLALDLLEAVDELIQLLLRLQVAALVVADQLLSGFCDLLVGLAINYLEVMVQSLLYPPLVVPVLSLSTHFSLQLSFLLRNGIELSFLLPFLPFLELDVLLDLRDSVVKPFYFHILVVDAILRPSQLRIGPSIVLVLLANVLILLFRHLYLFVHLLDLVLQVFLAVHGLIAGYLPLPLEELIDLVLHLLVLLFQLVVLLLHLAVVLDFEQDVGVFLLEIAVFLVESGLLFLEGQSLVSVGLFFVLALLVVVADLLVPVLNFLYLLR